MEVERRVEKNILTPIGAYYILGFMSKLYNKVYRKNQLTGALWAYLATFHKFGDKKGLPKTPKVFESRIRKLLNLDRDNGKPYIFFDGEGQGTGSEEFYSEFHVFLMGIALRMLDIGFKQAEVIFFLKHTKLVLSKQYEDLNSGKIAPITRTNRDPNMEDICYMLVRRIEAKEIYSTTKKDAPLILMPEFVFGLKQFQRELAERPNEYGSFATIELADLALSLKELLEAVPAAGRGRPKA